MDARALFNTGIKDFIGFAHIIECWETMSRNTQVILVISIGIIGFIIGVLINPTILHLFQSTSQPDLKGHDFRIIMNSTTMQPTINEGAIVYIDVITMGNIKLNDIIAFHSPFNWDTLIIHRVVEKVITTDGVILRTKGDNNPVRDPWQLQEEYIVGVVAEWE